MSPGFLAGANPGCEGLPLVSFNVSPECFMQVQDARIYIYISVYSGPVDNRNVSTGSRPVRKLVNSQSGPVQSQSVGANAEFDEVSSEADRQLDPSSIRSHQTRFFFCTTRETIPCSYGSIGSPRIA